MKTIKNNSNKENNTTKNNDMLSNFITAFSKKGTSDLIEENTSLKNKNEVLENENEVLETQTKELKNRNEELEAKVKYYEEQLRINAHRMYGKSSEKISEGQISMFNEAEKLSSSPCEEPVLEDVLVKRSKKRTKTRKTYDDLPIEEIYYSLSEEEQICPTCENELHEMKIEVRKELKVIPAKVVVTHHKRQVYACRKCDVEGLEGTIIKAEVPNPVLPGSMVSPSLLAFIIEKKYNQALPIYRQEKGFVDFGIEISRQNMASWIIKGSENWLQFIYDRMKVELSKETIVQADETDINVIDEKKNKKNYMWTYNSAKSSDVQIKLFEYQSSRAGKHAQKFLEDFSGYLQTDGFSGYNLVDDVVQVGCMAHCKRKYNDALKALPEGVDPKNTESYKGLTFCKQIYRIERKLKDLPFEERFIKRLEETTPVLIEFKEWLAETKANSLPKGLLGTAVTYSLNQWDKLTSFMYDGRMEVDNNLAERSIKPFVIGRKNWLFSKSPRGAQSSAICYSIVETAKANDLKPFHYLMYLFEKLPNIDLNNLEELDKLLPWAKEIPEEFKNKITTNSN